MNNCKKLNNIGQSVWFDSIQRSILADGSLDRMIKDGLIYGVTSNPSIFNTAISKTEDYDDAILSMAIAGFSSEEIYNQLAREDILSAADSFMPLYQASNRKDGYVSIEVNPMHAGNSKKMLSEAREIWRKYQRPNIMIKVPATLAGLVTTEKLIREGINVNVTLIFTLSRYRKVVEAFLSGLEKRLTDGNSIENIASVASFFVSRVDTKIDKMLVDMPSQSAKIKDLYGKAAIANTRLVYEVFQKEFSSSRFKALTQKGAQVQRPLWASTGTKNPEYSDVVYVDELIGPDTVNTVPPATLTRFLDHGKTVKTITTNLEGARCTIQSLQELGISLEDVGVLLEKEGIQIFADAYRSLIRSIEIKRRGMNKRLGSLGKDVTQQIQKLDNARMIERIYAHDPKVWTDDPGEAGEIKNRLGWLDLPSTSMAIVDEIKSFKDDVIQCGYKHIFILGMGGSSLAPEVFKLVLGSTSGLDLVVVDSTDPDQIRSLYRGKDLEKSLFIVSSKSGGTSEVNAFLDFFWAKCYKNFKEDTGMHFVAITDQGTSLDKLAIERGFRKVFYAHSSVGGRFSALTAFGLVPAALLGIDPSKILKKAGSMARQCFSTEPAGRNPGLVLGAVIGQAALGAKNKLSLLADPEIRPFGNWIEQLVAESSGKKGFGIVPVVEEYTLPARDYCSDRLTIYLRLNGAFDTHIRKLEKAKQPVVVINFRNREVIFQEFYRWEFATTVACSILKVNVFDQPDVQDNKIRTANKIKEYQQKGVLDEPPILWKNDKVNIYAPEYLGIRQNMKLKEIVNHVLAMGKAGDYTAINAYLPYDKSIIKAMDKMRRNIQKKTGMAATRGFGPRFLHSTGQLHKGGPNTGIFIQITREPLHDLDYGDLSFGTLERAQALGDYESLVARKRRIIRIHMKKGSLTTLVKELF
ncbi:MAG: transaldolase [Anaerolinea sp.]|nr:transaldolase [Anaerolinea sp.]